MCWPRAVGNLKQKAFNAAFLSTTIVAILTVFFAPLASLPEPFTPILWVAIIMDGPPAVSLALDAARPGIMFEPPRSRTAPVLPFSRLAKIMAYGITMMVGTLAVLYYGLHIGTEQRALTLALTTFVLFQFFNVLNARTEKGTSFNTHFLDNTMFWVWLAGIIALQALAVHWPRAQPIFGTGGMTLADLGIATGVAASVLILEKGRKLALAMLGRLGPRATPAGSV
jgi:Ca2+-transporting ATPase